MSLCHSCIPVPSTSLGPYASFTSSPLDCYLSSGKFTYSLIFTDSPLCTRHCDMCLEGKKRQTYYSPCPQKVTCQLCLWDGKVQGGGKSIEMGYHLLESLNYKARINLTNNKSNNNSNNYLPFVMYQDFYILTSLMLRSTLWYCSYPHFREEKTWSIERLSNLPKDISPSNRVKIQTQWVWVLSWSLAHNGILSLCFCVFS